MAAPTRYTAFLRAINVGGHRKIKMADLRKLLSAAGLERVATFIQSGNVVFDAANTDSADLEQHIEQQLRQAYGFDVATFVRLADEIIALAGAQPFGAAGRDERADMYVAFLRHAVAGDRVVQLLAYSSPVDTLRVDGAHAYWLRRRDLGESAIANDRIEKALGVESTMRNMTTIRKLVDKLLLPAD